MAIEHPGRWIGGAAILLLLCTFLFQVPGCVMALGPKVGRVIDKDTGEGIPGAAVVAEGHFAQKGLWQGFQTCTYGVITYTDKDGNFALPSVFSHWSVGAPYADPQQWFEVSVSKAGYVYADVALPLKFDTTGGLRGSVHQWDSRFHSVSWVGYAVKIPPIELKQAELSLREQIAYFGEAKMNIFMGCPTDATYRAQMQEEIRASYRREMTRICNAPAGETIETPTLGALATTASDYSRFEKRMNESAIPALRANPSFRPYNYPSSDVCEAMKAGDYK